MSEDVVKYHENDGIAVIILNRPDQLNTLTETMVQGVADAVDRATAARGVRAIVLRGEGRAFAGGYDLNAGGLIVEQGFLNPFGAPRPEPRRGA